MPVPIILGMVAGASALYGVAKGVKGAVDHSDASEIDQNARSMVDTSNANLEKQRQATNDILTDYGGRKLRAFNGIIAEFIDAFSRLKNVDTIHTVELEKLNLGDFSITTLGEFRKDYEMLQSAGLGLGAGIGGGAALAFGAYNGTMLLATAGTGTAISGLSGVAATNATLAWLGGGTLAAGGGGMALGTMVLGAMVAGPALAIFGHMFGNKAEEALNTARSNLEQATTVRDHTTLMVGKLQAIADISNIANGVFSNCTAYLRRSVGTLKVVLDGEGENYQVLSSQSKETVFRTVKFAQLLKAMIDTPILDQDGNLVLSTEKRFQEIKESLN